AALALLPFYLLERRKFGADEARRSLKASILPGLVLSLHFMSWTFGARLAPAANSSLIINLAPIAMPFLLYLIIREKLTRIEIGGTALAFAGVIWLGMTDFNLSQDHFRGDLICFGSMILFALYLVIGRRNRELKGIWLYVVPLYLTAGLLSLATAVLSGAQPMGDYPPREILWILGLALVPTVMGHSSINWAIRHISGQSVGVINQLQFIFAGTTAWFVLAEKPVLSFYAASALICAGVVVVILGHRREA
ncbi:MAG: DMT family transporter, partial [Verrucomicrobiota bacterium]